MRYVEMLLVALDCAVNVLLGGVFSETLSARAWRMEQQGKPWGRIFRPLIDGLFFYQPNHCRTQFERERRRLGLIQHP